MLNSWVTQIFRQRFQIAGPAQVKAPDKNQSVINTWHSQLMDSGRSQMMIQLLASLS